MLYQLDVQAVSRKLGPLICNALPGFHAVTGCDAVSVFSGKGKGKTFAVLQGDDEYVAVLSSLGDQFTISNDLMEKIERFLGVLYGYDMVCYVN